jgi:hypothetical protein
VRVFHREVEVERAVWPVSRPHKRLRFTLRYAVVFWVGLGSYPGGNWRKIVGQLGKERAAFLLVKFVQLPE